MASERIPSHHDEIARCIRDSRLAKSSCCSIEEIQQPCADPATPDDGLRIARAFASIIM